MTHHSLDGNAIAADRHHGQPEAIQDGGPCPRCDDGILDVQEPDEDDPKGSAWCSECGRIEP